MHPGIHSKVKFPINKMNVLPGMIVEFMYQSSYYRSGKKPTGPRNLKRLLWVTDPYYARKGGGGDDVDSRGFYMWGIDLEKLTPAQFVMFGPKKFGVEYYGPNVGRPVAKGAKYTQIAKFPNIITVVDVPGQNGQAKWQMIKGLKPLIDNFRSYDIDRIKGCNVGQYHFVDPIFKVNFKAGPAPDPNADTTSQKDKEQAQDAMEQDSMKDVE